MLVILLAWIDARNRKQGTARAVHAAPRWPAIAAAGSIVAALLCWNAHVGRAAMDGYRAAVAIRHSERDVVEDVEHALAAWSPQYGGARYVLAKEVLESITDLLTADRRDDARSLLLALDEAVAAHRHGARDIQAPIVRARTALLLDVYFGEAEHVAEIYPDLEARLDVSPRRQEARLLLAALELRLGRGEDAVARLRRMIADAPDLGTGYVQLAWTLSYLGRDAEASHVVDAARQQRVRLRAEDEPKLEAVARAILRD